MSSEKNTISPYQAIEVLYTCVYPHQSSFMIPGLLTSQYEVGILGALAQGNEFSSQRTLMKLLGISRPSITLILDDMEKKDLINRVVDTGDKRANKVIITSKGRKVLAWQCDRKKRFEEIMNVGITEEELQIHLKITQKMVENILDISERQLTNMPSFEEFTCEDNPVIPNIMSEEYQKAFVSMMQNVEQAKKKSAH